MANATVRRAGYSEYPGDDAAGWDREVLGLLLLPAVTSSHKPCQAFSLCFSYSSLKVICSLLCHLGWMAVSWCHCSILIHFWLKFNQFLPWALGLVLLSHWRHTVPLYCATPSNQIPSLSVKQAKHILDSCTVLCQHSWQLLRRCWEVHAWPCSQDRTPLFLMSQQTPPGPGSHICSPPVSAEGPLPQQKRRWTVKATQGCFHTKLTPSTGSWRPWTHSMTIPKPLPHSLPATAPSRPCPGTPAPSLQPGAAASCQSTDMAAAAKTHPAAATAWPGEMGYGSKGPAQGPDHHPMDSSNMSLQHPWQTIPRRSHLSAIFWCICSFCQKNRNKIEGCNTCESSEHLWEVLSTAGGFALCMLTLLQGYRKQAVLTLLFWQLPACLEVEQGDRNKGRMIGTTGDKKALLSQLWMMGRKEESSMQEQGELEGWRIWRDQSPSGE